MLHAADIASRAPRPHRSSRLMRSTFQKPPSGMDTIAVGRSVRVALLLLGLSAGWNSFVLPARAASVNVGIAATGAPAADSGASPTNTSTFAISRASANKNDGDATVTFSISGTADNGADYSLRLPDGSLLLAGATSGTVIIPNGRAGAVITVEPVDDTFPEDVESVTLTLTSADLGYLIAPSPNDSSTVTIADNDTTVSINATVADAAEAGSVPGIFTVSLTDNLGIPIAPSFP